jgi:twitching motility two-component system response regulator PilH
MSTSKPTALIVDDNETDRAFLKAFVSKLGHLTIEAVSGEDAIVKAKANKPNYVLMDIVMPGMDGFTAIKRLSEDSETATIPVIICSTKNQVSDKNWGTKVLKARDFVTKPLSDVNNQKHLEAAILKVIAVAA